MAKTEFHILHPTPCPHYYFVHHLPTSPTKPLSVLASLASCRSLHLHPHKISLAFRFDKLERTARLFTFSYWTGPFLIRVILGSVASLVLAPEGPMMAVILNAYNPCGNGNSKLLGFLSMSLFYNRKHAIAEPTLPHRTDVLL